jgi:hypothetical protein
MVPPPRYDLSKAGAEEIAEAATKEGFVGSSAAGGSVPITVDQLKTLNQKITVEVLRLQASGTSDPVIQARVAVFTKLGHRVSDIQTQIGNGKMLPADIPITQNDLANFLPSLGDTSAGISGLISKSGNSTLSSLFNSYEKGDISGSQIAASLFDNYANTLLQGLSLSVNYTSPNQVSLAQAQAQAQQPSSQPSSQPSRQPSSQPTTMNSATTAVLDALTSRPSTVNGFRGEFDQTIQNLSSPSSTKPSGYDWKAMAASICSNIRKMSLNPADFGCIEQGTQVSQDFSWRGHCKMVCSRLATHYDPGIPEQMGCPPATWKGWRL